MPPPSVIQLFLAWSHRRYTTFTGQISDTLAAIDYLATQPVIDMQRLDVLGFSQGGLVATEVAARDPRIRTIVLWSSVANAPDTYKHILSAETVASDHVFNVPTDSDPAVFDHVVAVTTHWRTTTLVTK